MLTNAEVSQKMAELEVNVLNKVKLVPFGEIEYKLGYISKVTCDLRTNTIMYLIVLENGNKVYKTPNAKFLEILDEKVEIVQKSKVSQNLELIKLKEENANLTLENEELRKKLQELEKEAKKLLFQVNKLEKK